MKRLLYITTMIFGVMAGLFMFNKFYDLSDQAEIATLIFILSYCIHGLVILAIGLILFSKQKTIGFWVLLLFECYLIIRHSLEFRSYKLADQPFEIANEIIKNWTTPHYEIIFFTELLFGLTSIVLLLRMKKRRTVEFPNANL